MRSSATSILLSLTLGSTLLVPRSASAAEPACAHPAVSRFWQRTEALCTRARALKAEREAQPTPAPAEAPPDGAAAPEQPAPIPLPPFCATPGTLPDFASGSLADREAALTAAAAATGVPPEALGELKEQAPVVAALWLDELASRLAPESTFQTGAGADLLVSELVGAVCKQGARPWLEATCAPFGPGPALVELRKRLLLDVMKLPARAATVNQALAAEERLRATVALALLDAATSASGPYELAASLARLSAPAQVEQWCSANDSPPPKDDAAIASSVLLRLLADGPALDRPDAYYEAVVAHALGAARGGQAQLSTASRTALRQLLGALRALRKTSAAATPPESAELVTRLERLTTVATSLLVVVRDQPFVLPPSPIKLGRAVLEADLDVALQQALLATSELAHTSLTEGERDGIDAAVRFALAQDEEHAERILRGIVLPLGRWSESLLFDINADIPSLESGDVRIVGDALLGYNGRSWGVAGHGALSQYDFSSGNLISETLSVGGSLDAWLAGNVSRTVKLEGRFVGKASLYDTSKTNTEFADETSLMGSASLLGSVRYQPGERFAAGLWLGGGGQYEWYDTLQTDSGAANFETTENLGLILNARVRLELAIVPRWLVTRLRVDAMRFDIHRESLNMLADGMMITSATVVEEGSQLEVHTRLFLDAEVARLGGFVPSLNGGFDSISYDAPGDSHSAFVPVFGAGIRRDAF